MFPLSLVRFFVRSCVCAFTRLFILLKVCFIYSYNVEKLLINLLKVLLETNEKKAKTFCLLLQSNKGRSSHLLTASLLDLSGFNPHDSPKAWKLCHFNQLGEIDGKIDQAPPLTFEAFGRMRSNKMTHKTTQTRERKLNFGFIASTETIHNLIMILTEQFRFSALAPLFPFSVS